MPCQAIKSIVAAVKQLTAFEVPNQVVCSIAVSCLQRSSGASLLVRFLLARSAFKCANKSLVRETSPHGTAMLIFMSQMLNEMSDASPIPGGQ